MTMDGGIRMPSAPDVVMTPAPKRLGKPCASIAGRTSEPMATTVAGDEPDTAANSAQAMTPEQFSAGDVGKWIMRLAAPRCVRKVAACRASVNAMGAGLAALVN